jgi:preprotein translocase SecE subunit
MNKAIQFLKDTRAELKQVVWPSRTRAIVYAVIVVVLSVAAGYLFGGFDGILHTALRGLVG